MTLWSILKTCFRMKLVGAPWPTACADMSCIALTPKRCLVGKARSRKTLPAERTQQLLQCRLLLDPGIVVFLGLHFEIGLHVVVSKATKLGAYDFVSADFGRCEVNRDVQARHKVLLHPQ